MKLIVVTLSFLMIIMISLPSFAGTYVENFGDGDLDGWESIGPALWEIVDGVVTGRSNVSSGSGIMFGEDEWRNYTIECDSKIVETLASLPNASLGIRMLYRNISNFNYIWCLPSVGWGTALIWPWLNGNGLGTSAQKPFKQEMDRWYHFKAVANEDNFEFYIDGELMASYTDDRFPTGCIMLQTNACLSNFDNIVIAGDGIPYNTNNIAAVSSSGKLATKWGQIRSHQD